MSVLRAAPTPLALNTLPFSFIHLCDVDSTNAYALRHAEQLPHGTVIIAEQQRHGRGQHGRSWHSPRGNLYATLVLRTVPEAVHLHGSGWLTMMMALSVCRCLELCGGMASIKWPNDVLLADRKVAGVLAESAWQHGRLVLAAVGVGVNLNMSQDEAAKIDRPVAVAAHELGVPVERMGFLDELLDTFAQLIGETERAGIGAVRVGVTRRLALMGTDVCVETAHGMRSGRVSGIDDRGALLLVDRGGKLRRTDSGVIAC
jgi:BirA family transcriptional regulator, biotin operon repressor / biotin---[acetyl-CoA-carboxylase] ligase